MAGSVCSISTASRSRSTAFQLLHGLGSERLPVVGTHETVDAWVIRKGRSITVFLTNHAQPRHDITTQLVEVYLTDASAPLAA